MMLLPILILTCRDTAPVLTTPNDAIVPDLKKKKGSRSRHLDALLHPVRDALVHLLPRLRDGPQHGGVLEVLPRDDGGGLVLEGDLVALDACRGKVPLVAGYFYHRGPGGEIWWGLAWGA